MKQFSYEPEKIADDLFAIPLPLWDGSPVNSYVAIGSDGLWLIDGGLGSDECQATLRQGIRSLGFDFDRDVRALLVTHGHNDHVGAADAVLEHGGQLLAHRVEATAGRQIGFDEVWLRRQAGLPEDGESHGNRWPAFVWPEPTRQLEDDDRLHWGNLELQVVWCPGHTPGLVCLYEPTRKWLFTTDHVMRRAPAPIGVRHSSDDNPLHDYLGSVDKLKALNVHTVLPGHGRPFHHLRQRLQQIEQDIEKQLETVVELLRHGPATAFELAQASSLLRDRRPMAARYHVGLVLARLRFLERLGRIFPIETEGRIKYALPGS